MDDTLKNTGEAASSVTGGEGIDFDELMRKYDTEARFRTPPGWQMKLLTFLAVAMSCFHFYTAGMGLLPAQKQGAVHLAFTLVLVFLLYPIKSSMSKNSKVPIYDISLAILSVVPLAYLVQQINVIAMERSGMPTTMDIAMGFLLIAMLLEATRRISNPILPCLAVASILYCLFGRFMPEMISHRGFNIGRIINHMYLGTEGIFGTPLDVSSTFVFMFILFGSVLEKTGMGKFIIDLSLALAGWSTGGPAKVAVVASGLMGTISGSSVANVCTTGMFTIPLMKSVGYKPYFAGAVEAVASTGGQIMPPVMGAGAFIMAQFLGVGYLEVALAAVVPALLYYFAVIVQVHFEARRLGLKGLAREQLPKVGRLLKGKGFLLIPLAAIIYLLITGFTPLMAAFGGIMVSLVVSWANYLIVLCVVRIGFRNKSMTESLLAKFNDGRSSGVRDPKRAEYAYLENGAREALLTPRRILEAFEAGARGSLSVACACACVGIVVGMGTLTGLALRIAGAIVAMAGGKLILTLFFTMCASILLGTGLPTTANFIVTSTMAAPALFKLDVPPMAAYMFVFYFGIAADLTPPVALAAYAGAGIAGTDPMKTGFTAFKLALAGFIVPYIYVYNPILLFIDATPLAMIQAVVTALIGVFLLAMCTIGHYKTALPWFLRLVALAGAIGLLDPGTITDALGLAVLVAIHVIQVMRSGGKLWRA
ncbi:MAG: TRAP transporter permease [Synergistaceae bacterium]|jgi:TRAP transporter 4TM/12TM fusion protein|nr:TRAP transporter permease [Synergistaceae bacterium]